MKAIDGLYFHEIVLLGLGTLLFVALLVLLIIFAVQKRPIIGLVIFFFISIIMIGYPSIQKIEYDKGVLRLGLIAKDVKSDPSDSLQRDKLETQMSKIEERPTTNPKTLLDFGKIQAILGDTVKAEKLVNQALNLSPDLSEARILQTKFNTPQVQVEKIISEIENNPDNDAAKEELGNRISSFAMDPGANSSVLTTAAKAHAVLGDTSKALSMTNSALDKDKENFKATELKKRLTGRDNRR